MAHSPTPKALPGFRMFSAAAFFTLLTLQLLLPLHQCSTQALTPIPTTVTDNPSQTSQAPLGVTSNQTLAPDGDSDDDDYEDEPFPGHIAMLERVRPESTSVDKYLTIVIYCVGFPGNILSFVVWIQKKMRHSSGCYLAALALDDFIFLVLHLVFEFHMVWGGHPLDTPVFCQLFPIVFMCAQYLGPLLVLGFTTERYISICHPFKREKYCTVRRAKLVIAILVGSAVCLSGVQGYFYTMENNTYQQNNSTHNLSALVKYECGPRPEVSRNGNTSLLILWNLSIEILTFVLVPLTVLILNVLVIAEMRRLSRMEPASLHGHGHGQRTSATTVMLLAVSFYLILTTIPVTIVYTLFYEFQYDFPHTTAGKTMEDPRFHRWVNYQLVQSVIKEFEITHFAFNIFFYVITGKIFRQELKGLVVRGLCRGGKVSLSLSREYSSLRSSLRREGSKSKNTKNTWVSINGHHNTHHHHNNDDDSKASVVHSSTTETKV